MLSGKYLLAALPTRASSSAPTTHTPLLPVPGIPASVTHRQFLNRLPFTSLGRRLPFYFYYPAASRDSASRERRLRHDPAKENNTLSIIGAGARAELGVFGSAWLITHCCHSASSPRRPLWTLKTPWGNLAASGTAGEGFSFAALSQPAPGGKALRRLRAERGAVGWGNRCHLATASPPGPEPKGLEVRNSAIFCCSCAHTLGQREGIWGLGCRCHLHSQEKAVS